MSTLHTPGPLRYEVDPYEPNRGRILRTGGWVASILHNGEALELRQTADGRLWAAAPELLAALRLYLAAGFGQSTDPHAQGIAYDAAVEAVAKATGGGS